MGRTLHQIFGFFEMVFLADDPQLWLGVGCNAFSYQDFWWALPATWEPCEYRASPFIGSVRLRSVHFVGSVHIEVRFLWIHLPTKMCSSVLSFHQPNKTIYYIAGWASRVTWFVCPPIGRKTLLFYQGTRRWLGLSIHLWVGGLYFYQGIPTRKGSHEIRALMRIFLTRKYPPHQETKVDSTLL